MSYRTRITGPLPRGGRMSPNIAVLVVVALSAASVFADQKTEQLIRRLGSDSFTEREQATKDLIATGESALPFLRAMTKSPDFELAGRAKQIVTAIERNLVINSAIAGLKDPDPTKRASAAEAIRLLGPSGEPAVPVLIALLKDPDSKVRNRSAAALGRIGLASKAAVPNLLQMALNDNEPQETRLLALGSLWFIGPDAKDALAKAQKATEGKVSTKAQQALHDIERRQLLRP